MTMFRLLEKMKESLRPDADILQLAVELAKSIQDELRRRGVDADVTPGGSIAKGTFLAHDADIDLFARFSGDYADERLPDLLAPALKRFKPSRIHGSRDYFQFSHEGYTVEVVPVLRITGPGQARNVTDVSPLHVDYFRKQSPELADEVRLLKQFCKSAGVYGAESYLRGFSGHVIDLLLIHYGSFYELVKAAARWKPPVVIDLEAHHDDPLNELDKAKLGPLVLVDPVQPGRNAAAALSHAQFDRFVQRCRSFIADPDAEFFYIEDFSEDALAKELEELPGPSFILRLEHDAEDKRDVAGGKVRKYYERLRDELERSDFTLIRSGWHFSYLDTSILYYSLEEHSLPRMREHEGPPVDHEEDIAAFREKYDEPYERDGRLFAKRARKFTDPEDFLQHLLGIVESGSLSVSLRKVAS